MPDDKNPLTIVQLLAVLSPPIAKRVKELRLLSDPAMQQRFLQLEEIQTARNFKFGVLRVRSGQTTEEEMFANGAMARRALLA